MQRDPFSKRLLLIPIVWALLVSQAWARDIEAYLKEVERLRDGLPSRAYEDRQPLTEKLAGLYYNAALEASAAEVLDEAKLTRYRQRALSLYREFVSGNGGKARKPYGERLELARFQMARLYADLGMTGQATKIWARQVKLEEYPKLVAEAALWLAEIEEAKNPASAKALHYYDLAARNDRKQDTRSYANYRKAWILRNQDKLPQAIAILKEELWDSKGQVKEEVLRDLLVFHSLSSLPSDGVIGYFEGLADKLARPDLMSRLADSYLANGRRIAAVAALKEAVAKNPRLKDQVRLLEESYGLRQWETFAHTLAGIQAPDLGSLDQEDVAKTEKTLMRIAVQLDADRLTNKQAVQPFVDVVDLFLQMFPRNETCFKLVQGGIAAREGAAYRIRRIRLALANQALGLTKAQRHTLYENLISYLQKEGDHKGAAREAGLLAAQVPKASDRRRFRFVQASELFDGGNKQQALPILKALVKENPTDDFGRKSQLMYVRILAEKGEYATVLESSRRWLGNVAPNRTIRSTKEYLAVVEIKERSEFEWAAGVAERRPAKAAAADPGGPSKGGEAAGQAEPSEPQAQAALTAGAAVGAGASPADNEADLSRSLEIFNRNCTKRAFLPQSCDNAKSLAVKLRRYDILFPILVREKKYDELATIYEANGFFAKAGKQYETLWMGEGERLYL